MDEEDLFGVFDAKDTAKEKKGKGKGVVKTQEDTDKAAKRKQPEDNAADLSQASTAVAPLRADTELKEQDEDEEDEDGEEGGDEDKKTKKSKKDVDLCPAAGPGSCVIHDITPPGQTEGRKACRHHVAVPPGMDIEDITAQPPARTPAKEYKFVLDPFQRAAVNCLEKGQSVLVSAHTSAGKTAVAEYAIAMALRDKQRVVYTSPIKALSNQKFRELTDEFTDVGLMTGDVTINPEASLLVMTTEILRSMLYRGSELMREVVWIIYDEIHYMRDRERGVVWEESIVLVPSKIRFVFLSATIPNAPDFACWISRVHMQPCNVVYTDYR